MVFFSHTLFSIIEVILVMLPVLIGVAFVTVAERKTMASMQRRLGPVIWFGKLNLWAKLSNSGDSLKLMVPNHRRNTVSGWINQSGMVISHKMIESETGYRGSNSVICKSIAVKEQRLDGSWGNFTPLPLRYCLMGFARNYQLKIPSKQINRTFSFTSIAASYEIKSQIKPEMISYLLNSNFITGFTDAEGSFIISIQKEPKNKTGWTVKSRFSIGLHEKDREILELIKYYFKGKGTITKQGNNSVQYRVASLKDLTNVIIPHFDNHPLITQKKPIFFYLKRLFI